VRVLKIVKMFKPLWQNHRFESSFLAWRLWAWLSRIETTKNLSYSLKLTSIEFVEKLKPVGVIVTFSEITRITSVRNAVNFKGIAMIV